MNENFTDKEQEKNSESVFEKRQRTNQPHAE